jgi:hypothetical protein
MVGLCLAADIAIKVIQRLALSKVNLRRIGAVETAVHCKRGKGGLYKDPRFTRCKVLPEHRCKINIPGKSLYFGQIIDNVEIFSAWEKCELVRVKAATACQVQMSKVAMLREAAHSYGSDARQLLGMQAL